MLSIASRAGSLPIAPPILDGILGGLPGGGQNGGTGGAGGTGETGETGKTGGDQNGATGGGESRPGASATSGSAGAAFASPASAGQTLSAEPGIDALRRMALAVQKEISMETLIASVAEASTEAEETDNAAAPDIAAVVSGYRLADAAPESASAKRA